MRNLSLCVCASVLALFQIADAFAQPPVIFKDRDIGKSIAIFGCSVSDDGQTCMTFAAAEVFWISGGNDFTELALFEDFTSTSGSSRFGFLHCFVPDKSLVVTGAGAEVNALLDTSACDQNFGSLCDENFQCVDDPYTASLTVSGLVRQPSFTSTTSEDQKWRDLSTGTSGHKFCNRDLGAATQIGFASVGDQMYVVDNVNVFGSFESRVCKEASKQK